MTVERGFFVSAPIYSLPCFQRQFFVERRNTCFCFGLALFCSDETNELPQWAQLEPTHFLLATNVKPRFLDVVIIIICISIACGSCLSLYLCFPLVRSITNNVSSTPFIKESAIFIQTVFVLSSREISPPSCSVFFSSILKFQVVTLLAFLCRHVLLTLITVTLRAFFCLLMTKHVHLNSFSFASNIGFIIVFCSLVFCTP